MGALTRNWRKPKEERMQWKKKRGGANEGEQVNTSAPAQREQELPWQGSAWKHSLMLASTWLWCHQWAFYSTPSTLVFGAHKAAVSQIINRIILFISFLLLPLQPSRTQETQTWPTSFSADAEMQRLLHGNLPTEITETNTRCTLLCWQDWAINFSSAILLFT